LALKEVFKELLEQGRLGKPQFVLFRLGLMMPA